MHTVLGVDGCRLGWVGVELRGGRFGAAHAHARLADLLEAVPAARAVGVDIPLGLMDARGRDCDKAARALLGDRAASLFVMPPRPVFDAPDHAGATATAAALTGSGISIQTWQLRRKIREAEGLYTATGPPLYEVHPELSFRMMGLRSADGRKKSWRGQRARLRVLGAHGIELPEDLGADVAAVPADDVLDATAAAFSAHRIATGIAQCLPDPAQVNERGQRLAIWY